MRFYFHKTPGWLRKIYPEFNWEISTDSKDLFLTFDDGPVSGATPYILEILEKFNAKATFFVVGDNVRKNKGIIKEVVAAGHQVGNHTYNHVSGWNQSREQYLEQAKKCDEIIEDVTGENSGLFRPPYGRITLKQASDVSKKYKVVMWDILSGDFDRTLNHRGALKQLKKSQPGSISVFHDNQKYIENVKKLLPEFLAYFADQEFMFQKIEKPLLDD